MHHGVDMAVVALIAGALVAWSLVSARLERWNVTAPIAFVAVGLIVANPPFELVNVRLSSAGVREIAEFALAVVLFGDAARVDLRKLQRDAALPVRLLLLGLPLTMALGTLAAHSLLPGLSWWVCAVIGAAVAPTDAALGGAIIEDSRVPAKIRRVLNVESGLNDGIATPFVNFFLAAAVVGTALETSSEGRLMVDILVGVLAGALIGGIGGWALERARSAGLAGAAYRPLAVAALSLFAYSMTLEIGGNGFVAAFVAGLAYGRMTGDADATLEFTHDVAELMSLVVWFLFGAVVVPALGDATWRDVVFAIAALTIIRMVPVAVSLARSGLDAASVAVVGWFGPRGLASVVFALLAFDELAPSVGRRVVTVVATTVTMSVVLHGVSASPIAKRFGASDHLLTEPHAGQTSVPPA